jgi:three-Cys-motif partner protein
MAKSNDREHFEDYREQTQLKHEILAAYLPAYYNILKVGGKNLLFIDGFAGRGTYTKQATDEAIDGSPLRALKLIAANKDFTKQVGTIFIEADEVLFTQLEQQVDHFYKEHPEIRKPVCLHGTFSDRVKEVLAEVKGKLAPTFLFVDPCGVSGTSFDTIRAVMACDKCEAFIFFNIDGVRRTAGLEALSNTLVELMGTEVRAQALYDALGETEDVGKREGLILSHYSAALREDIGAKYIAPFRVESEDKRTTSHYFIHASKHPLGFRIMKDVMWGRGHAQDQVGGLEFAQRSRTNFYLLFDFRGDAIKHNILKALEDRPQLISVFYEEWPERPDDLFCEAAYRTALLELEADGSIEVLSKDGKNVVGVEARRKWKGKPTLARDYFVRLGKGKR